MTPERAKPKKTFNALLALLIGLVLWLYTAWSLAAVAYDANALAQALQSSQLHPDLEASSAMAETLTRFFRGKADEGQLNQMAETELKTAFSKPETERLIMAKERLNQLAYARYAALILMVLLSAVFILTAKRYQGLQNTGMDRGIMGGLVIFYLPFLFLGLWGLINLSSLTEALVRLYLPSADPGGEGFLSRLMPLSFYQSCLMSFFKRNLFFFLFPFLAMIGLRSASKEVKKA